MAVITGRANGYIAMALEASAGAPAQPVAYIPYLESTLNGRQDVLADSSARGVRDENAENSQLGKRWGEGNLRVNLDATLAGYLMALAMGSRSVVSEGGGVYTHTFSRNNSNTPLTSSVIFNRGTDKVLFHYAVVNSFDLTFDDGMAEVNAGFTSKFPVTSTSGTLTTTSGFYYAFRHATVQISDTITNAANSATPLKVRSFSLSINNNTENQFVAGNREPDSIINKSFSVTGSMRLAFESSTEKDYFINLTKTAMVVTFNGNGIGNAMTEFVKLRIYKMRVDDFKVDVPNDDYVSEEITFTAEYSSTDTATCDLQARNRQSSY